MKGFKRPVQVPNYPLRKRTEKEYQLIRKLKLLRKIELREFKKRRATKVYNRSNRIEQRTFDL